MTSSSTISSSSSHEITGASSSPSVHAEPANPHSETKPDFSLEDFRTKRKRFTDNGMSEEAAINILSEDWDDEHARRISLWDAARALAASDTPATIPGTPAGLGSNGPVPTPEIQVSTSIPSTSTTNNAVPAKALPDLDVDPSSGADQGSSRVIHINESLARPSDNLPTLANAVTIAMTNRAYIPLYYLTAEGRNAADLEGLNSTNPFDGSKVSQNLLKNLRRDRELSISEFHEAAPVMLQLIKQHGWGVFSEKMFFKFFAGIDRHPFRHEGGPHAVGPRALALYAERARKKWHDELIARAATGEELYSIAEIDVAELSHCHMIAQNEAFDLRMQVRFSLNLSRASVSCTLSLFSTTSLFPLLRRRFTGESLLWLMRDSSCLFVTHTLRSQSRYHRSVQLVSKLPSSNAHFSEHKYKANIFPLEQFREIFLASSLLPYGTSQATALDRSFEHNRIISKRCEGILSERCKGILSEPLRRLRR